MNLSELKITQQLKQAEYPHRLSKIIQDHGWTVLGSGVEGIVAGHPNKPYVLKIYESSSIYSKFVELVQQNPKNKHFPRFSRYVRDIPGAPQFKYVRMEILEPVTSQQLKTSYLPYLCTIANTVKQAKTHHEDLFWNNVMLLIKDQVKKQFPDGMAGCEEKSPTSWRQAVNLTIKAMPDLGINQLDLHYANMMLRGSTLVITDPWYKDQ